MDGEINIYAEIRITQEIKRTRRHLDSLVVKKKKKLGISILAGKKDKSGKQAEI